MNLPALIQRLYGVFAFTGLYSFEFVDKNRNTITEIFFMIPPKTKAMNEPTRSTTVPTLNGNYNLDAGNATKETTLTGDLYFPYVGSPDNPVAPDNSNLTNTIDGLNEFFKLRWMLIRYRDYTMTKKAKITVPTSLLALSPQIAALYKAVSKRMSKKVGALYDQIQIIFHDYDMNDHFFCRVASFASNQSDTKHLAASYTIQIECTEPDTGRKGMEVKTAKKETNESINAITQYLIDIDFLTVVANIQNELGNNSDLISPITSINSSIINISSENDSIQAGKTTATTSIPIYISNIITQVGSLITALMTTFLTADQQTDYDAGTLTLDDIFDIDMITFYNALQKIKLYATAMQGVINSIPKQNEIRFYSNANNYTLTEEQFSGDESVISNDAGFYYYTVMAGDTARIVALRELHDPDKFINILQANDISENDFIDGTLIGQQIKIPIMLEAISKGDDNLVYESDTTDMDAFIYGKDLASDINNKLKVSATGDLQDIKGSDNVIEKVTKRLEKRKGSLNIFSPAWGTIAIDDSNAPFLVKIDRYLTDVIDQIQSDPRIDYVKLDMNKIKLSGETISASIQVFLTGTDEFREVTI